MTTTQSTTRQDLPHQPIDGSPAPPPPRVVPPSPTGAVVATRAAIARAIMRRAVKSLPIRVYFPDGTYWGNGRESDPRMLLHRPAAFFARLGVDAKLGFGEAYMAGDWDAAPGTDLGELLTPFATNLTTLVPLPLQRFRSLVDRRQPAAEENTLSQSRQNIHRHYDLSNDLFTAFLDETLNYSSAWFEPGDDLAAAQRRKMDSILDFANVRPNCDVLEIGTGWGDLAIRAAQRGANVTSVTLSKEQRELAMERVQLAGVSDRVRIELKDYRQVTGKYDAIVSVEMLEAVGMRYWPTFFATLDRLLRPGGQVGLQTITMPHDRMLATRRSYTWIHKYIFPGGIIPSVRAIEDVLSAHTGLAITDGRALGPHYATTLGCWRENFLANWTTISRKGFDSTFRRMWEFYLAYCEAGFRADYLDVHQFRLARVAG
ncbi:MAG: cyclopropane-fatty-acyl-phospholipid synthase family protein [Nakamurella sp.]